MITVGKVYDEVMVEIVPGHFLKGVIIEDNQAVIAQNTLAKSIDKGHQTVARFSDSKYFKRKCDKGFTPAYQIRVHLFFL